MSVTDNTGLMVAGRCRFCCNNLRGELIPIERRDCYGGKTHFSKVVGIEYHGEHAYHHDGVSEWMCPYCTTRINRWTHEVIPNWDEAATPDGNVKL